MARGSYAASYPSASWGRSGQRNLNLARKFGRYGKHLLGGLAVAALGSLGGSTQNRRLLPPLDGYTIDQFCAPPAGFSSISGNCGTFTVNNPVMDNFPPVTGRPLVYSVWKTIGPINAYQSHVQHLVRYRRIATQGMPQSGVVPFVPIVVVDALNPGQIKPGREAVHTVPIPWKLIPGLAQHPPFPQWRVGGYAPPMAGAPPGTPTKGGGNGPTEWPSDTWTGKSVPALAAVVVLTAESFRLRVGMSWRSPAKTRKNVSSVCRRALQFL